MTRTIAGVALGAALSMTVLLAACTSSSDGDESGTEPSTTVDASTETTAPVDSSDDTSGTTDTAAGPDDGEEAESVRNGDVVCDVLSAEDVSEAIGIEVTGTDGYGLSTPQCSYTFDDGDTVTNVSVAAPRSEEDLGGLTGTEGFDFAVEVNLSLGDDITSDEISVDGADEAAHIEGSALSGLVLLVDDDVYTIFSSALDPSQLEALGATVAAAVA